MANSLATLVVLMLVAVFARRTRRSAAVFVIFIVANSPPYITQAIAYLHRWGITPGLRNERQGFYTVMAYKWLASALVILLVIWWEREPLRSIGFKRPDLGDAVWAVGGFVGATLLAVVLSAMLHPGADAGYAFIASLSPQARIALWFNASITEEILSRGYQFERLATLTRKPWLAALATFILFTVGHAGFFHWRTVIAGTLPGAVALTIVYWRRRSLSASVLLHALLDAGVIFAGH